MDKRAELVERMLEAYTYASRSGITNGMSAALDLALEEAARVCDEKRAALLAERDTYQEMSEDWQFCDEQAFTAGQNADAIRALKSKP
jgi:hypothetical protein